jgi:hypothetical protein
MKEHKLLIASFLTILVAGLGFAVRTKLLGEWASDFGFTQTDLGQITVCFWTRSAINHFSCLRAFCT